jgi:uncharacterized protein YndB with AHSA1/START domain
METNTSTKEILITRLINAPREAVFKAWIDPEQLVRWYAPKPCTIHFKKIDVREGGEFHSCIHVPNFKNCWCKGVYKEVRFPERLVFSMLIADEAGNTSNAVAEGMDPDWPTETTVTVTFEDQDGKTLLTLQQTVSEDLAKRTGAYPSWLQQLDNLQEHLLAMKSNS